MNPGCMQISETFSTGMGLIDYRGQIVASAEALFLFPHAIAGLHEANVLDGVIDNAVAGMAQQFLDPQAGQKPQLMTCDISELPTVFTQDPSWPIKFGQGKIVVVPKEAVVRIYLAFMGDLQVFTDQKRFNVKMALFKRGKVRQYLRDGGWQL